MPIHKVSGGWQWGNHGKVYPNREGAERQAAAAHANGYAGDAAPRAAGVLLLAPTGRALWLLRSSTSDQPGTWCLPGGGAEADETPDAAALRELQEETGYTPAAVEDMTLLHEAEQPVNFVTFGAHVPQEFVPVLNTEHVAYAWAPLAQPPGPLHPGVATMLQQLGSDFAQDAKVAKASVQYGPSTGAHRCSACAHYMDGACELVLGTIEPDYWCKLWTLADRYDWRRGDIEVLEVGQQPAPLPDDEDEDYVDTVTEPVVTVHVYPEETDA